MEANRANVKECDICLDLAFQASLDKLLYRFYADVRKVDGELYKKTAFMAKKYGINRYLQDVWRKAGKGLIDIVRDAEFKKSNDMFSAMMKKLKMEGKADIEHYPPLELRDLHEMAKYFNEKSRDSLVTLQQKVFVDIMVHFARRGRENIRQMKISAFAVTRDSSGDMYLYKALDEQTKNHSDDTDVKMARMNGNKESDLCPVRTFDFHKRRLNPMSPWLFQRPKSQKPMNPRDPWYDRIPVSEKKIGSMMADISVAAGLSSIYTNHSLRATSVTMLEDAGQDGRHIIKITQHKSVNSLKTYGRLSDRNRKTMSNIISYGLGGNDTGTFDDCENRNKTPKVALPVSHASKSAVLSPKLLINLSSGQSPRLSPQLPISLSSGLSPRLSPRLPIIPSSGLSPSLSPRQSINQTSGPLSYISTIAPNESITASPDICILDAILSNIDLDNIEVNLPHVCEPQNAQVNNCNQVKHDSLFQPIFHNCNVTLNYQAK